MENAVTHRDSVQFNNSLLSLEKFFVASQMIA